MKEREDYLIEKRGKNEGKGRRFKQKEVRGRAR